MDKETAFADYLDAIDARRAWEQEHKYRLRKSAGCATPSVQGAARLFAEACADVERARDAMRRTDRDSIKS